MTPSLPPQVVPAVEESITVAHIVVEASSRAEEIGNASAIVGERLPFIAVLEVGSLVQHPSVSSVLWPINDISVLHARG